MKSTAGSKNLYALHDARRAKHFNTNEQASIDESRRIFTRPVMLTDWRFLRTYRGDTHAIGKFSTTGRNWVTPPLVRLHTKQRAIVARDGQIFVLVDGPGEPAVAAMLTALFSAFDERLQGRIDDVTQHICVSIDVGRGLHPFSVIVELNVTGLDVKGLDFLATRHTMKVRR